MYSRTYETPNNVIIYNAGEHSGNLGGRAGANAICAASSNRPITGFTNYIALMSFSTSDTIENLATTYTTLKQNTPIQSTASGVTATIASNWADLIDGIQRKYLTVSAAMPLDNLWWSGTKESDGSYIDSCNGFTSTSGTGVVKYTGFYSTDTEDWMKYDQALPCDNSVYVMCIAW